MNFSAAGKMLSQPVFLDDNLIFAAEDRCIYCLDDQGNLKWKFFSGKRLSSYLAIGPDKSIYFLSESGFLFALNSRGNLIWKKALPGAPTAPPCILGNGKIILSIDKKKLVCYSFLGRPCWEIALQRPLSAGPWADSQMRIYLALKRQGLWTFDQWGRSIQALRVYDDIQALVPGSNFLFCLTDKAAVQKIDLSKGELLSEYKSHLRGQCYLLSLDHIPLLLISEKGEIRILDKNCQVQKELSLRGPISLPPLPDKGNGLWFLSHNLISRINLESAEILEYESLTDNALFSALSPQGQLIFGLPSWLVYGYQVDRLAQGLWPTERGGPRGSGMTESKQVTFNEKRITDPSYLAVWEEGDLSQKKSLLSKIESQKRFKELGAEEVQIKAFLRGCAVEAYRYPQKKGKQILNNWPDIRARSWVLLGKMANLDTRLFILDNILLEWDLLPLLAALNSLGRIGSDPDGKSCRTLLRLFQEKSPTIRRDSRFVKALLLCLQQIRIYNGFFPDKSAGRLILSCMQGDYPKEIRKLASDILYQN